jgi:predicted RNase H-like HicB family nuclease
VKLHVVVEQDEGGYFVAEVPALPGCFLKVGAVTKLWPMLKEAIEGWFEVVEAGE